MSLNDRESTADPAAYESMLEAALVGVPDKGTVAAGVLCRGGRLLPLAPARRRRCKGAKPRRLRVPSTTLLTNSSIAHPLNGVAPSRPKAPTMPIPWHHDGNNDVDLNNVRRQPRNTSREPAPNVHSPELSRGYDVHDGLFDVTR